MHDQLFLANKEGVQISNGEIIGLDRPWIKADVCKREVTNEYILAKRTIID
jgi:hypothetical protein